MKRHSTLLNLSLLIVLLSGCAHGLTGKLPALDQRDNSSEVIIIRSCNLMWGLAVSFNISLDDDEIAAIRNCEYTRFLVSPGEHILSLENKAYRSTGINVNFTKGKRYFYYTGDGVELTISAISEKKAHKLLQRSKYIKIDNTLDDLSTVHEDIEK